MDDKGRVAIPSRFRELLASLGVGHLIVTNSDRCLDVYTPERWNRILDWVDGLPPFDEDVEAFRRYYISAAQAVEIDRQGRILIPPDLRAEVGLDKEVVVMGDGDKLQIWDGATWEGVKQDVKARFMEIKGKLSRLADTKR